MSEKVYFYRIKNFMNFLGKKSIKSMEKEVALQSERINMLTATFEWTAEQKK